MNELTAAFRIVMARRSGYIVLGAGAFHHEWPPIEFAGSLEDCLDFVRQEMPKHDNWRSVAQPPTSYGDGA